MSSSNEDQGAEAGGTARWAGALFALGLVVLVAAFAGAQWQRSRLTPRPGGSGDVGRVLVFVQSSSGPVRVMPGRRARLPRPQDIAFQFEAKGTGPRFLRIELETSGKRQVLYEERHEAPQSLDSLSYVLHLGEGAADESTLFVTLEAPHAESIESAYPLQLATKSTPFWR